MGPITGDQIRELQRSRFAYLAALYDRTNGSRSTAVDAFALGEELGLDRETTQKVFQYLRDEGLIEFRAFGPTIALTHYGIQQVERARMYPNEPTDHFQPINVIFARDIINSPIQQGKGVQSVTYAEGLSPEELRAIIAEIRGEVARAGLSDDDRGDVEADIATLEAQARRKSPVAGVVRETLLSILSTAEKAGVAGLGTLIGNYLTKLAL